MPGPTIDQRARQLEPGQLLILYELDLTIKGGPILYFHAGASLESTAAGENIIGFDGHTYTPYPIRAENFEWNTRGTLPRPTLTVSNIQSAVSALLRQYDDFVGCKVTVRRTFSDYILGGVNQDYTKEFTPQIFVVDRKTAETNTICAFDLATSMDAEGVVLPRRQILATACPFTYRGVECGYTGRSIRDRTGDAFGPSFSNGVITADPAAPYNGAFVILTSATASFVTGDVARHLTGTPFKSGSYVVSRESSTQIHFWPPSAAGGSGKTFVIGRVDSLGAWSAVTTYAQYDSAYLVVNGIQVHAVSKVGSNLNHSIYDENWWMLDVCLKKLGDCEDRFLHNQPSPYGGWPGVNKLS